MTNPCFWGAWTVGATAAAGAGVAAANAGEIAANAPSLFNRIGAWLYRLGGRATGIPVVRMGVNQVLTTCRNLN